MKTGGTLKIAIGLLRIDRVAQVSLASISAKDAQLAGYKTKEELLTDWPNARAAVFTASTFALRVPIQELRCERSRNCRPQRSKPSAAS